MKKIIFTLALLIEVINHGQLFAQTNKALSFNGKTSEISFNNNDLNLQSGNAMTVTTWAKWNTTANVAPWANLVSLSNSNGSGDVGQFWLQHDQTNSKFEFALQTAKSRSYVQSINTITPGVWYHIAGVYDGSNIYLYVNGVFQGKNVLTGNINNFQGNFKFNIGRWSNSTNDYRRFNGDIDEVTGQWTM